jgi:NCAIR mutase (PurE)-related protein
MSTEIRLDHHRELRIGIPEAILCEGKTDEHLCEILEEADRLGAALLLTRLPRERLAALPDRLRAKLDHEPVSRTAFFGQPRAIETRAKVAIVSAGTSDARVFREVARTLRFHGRACREFHDVGLAGLWRVMERVEEIGSHPIVIVVAGMDAALPTVVGGLVKSALIAVPTSNGYGVAAGGESALRATLASCSAGITVVNIDNGFGAACAAIRILSAIDSATKSEVS